MHWRLNMIKRNKKYHYGDEIIYHDELNDDFETTNLKRVNIPENYKYIKTNKFFRFFSFIIYYGIATPILWLFSKACGVKVKGKENLKFIRKGECFLYSNHTSFLDVFDITVLVSTFKKVNILGYSDSLSRPFLKHITTILGYLPIPDSPKTFREFQNSINYYVNEKKNNILIYPEAHIRPYYTKIRPFLSASFKYPAKMNKPAVPITACYRKSKISKKAKITLYVGAPIFPKSDLSVNENKEYLRNECYRVMSETAEKYSNYEYVKYKKGNDEIQD